MKKPQSFFWILTGCLFMAASLFSNQGIPGTNLRFLPEGQRKMAIEAMNHQSLSETGGVISGTLYGLSGDSWSTAMVMAWTADATGTVKDTLQYQYACSVQEDGSYEIQGLAEGGYYVQASADGYETLYYDNTKFLNSAGILTLTDQDTISGVNFSMTELTPGTGSISGRVTDEGNGNPIDHAVVYAFSENYEFNGKSETDMEGDFLIDGLKSGSYYVYVVAVSFVTEYYEDALSISQALPVVVEEPEERSDIDFQMSRGSSISGTVTDSSGAPLRDIYILALTDSDSLPYWIEPYDSGIGYYGSSTDSTGNYVIRELPPGNYYIRGDIYTEWGMTTVYYPGVTKLDDAIAVDVGKGIDITGIDFQITVHEPSGIIRGKVTDAKGNPLEGAVISLGTYPVWRSAMYYWGNATTDNTGCYTLEHIPEDSYTVDCSLYDGWQFVYYFWPGTENIEDAQAVEITAANPVLDHIDFQLPVTVSQASVSGTVRAVDGHPLMNAIIRMESLEENTGDEKAYRYTWAYSDSTGEYCATHVPAGSYTAKCEYYESMHFGEQRSISNSVSDLSSVL
jgi:protocatechuate 3,4-dioxygenase beta subunit